MLIPMENGHEYRPHIEADPRWIVMITRHPKYKTGWCVWSREYVYETRHHVSSQRANGKVKITRYATLQDAERGAAWLWDQMAGVLEDLEAEYTRQVLAVERGALCALEDLYADLPEDYETSADF